MTRPSFLQKNNGYSFISCVSFLQTVQYSVQCLCIYPYTFTACDIFLKKYFACQVRFYAHFYNILPSYNIFVRLLQSYFPLFKKLYEVLLKLKRGQMVAFGLQMLAFLWPRKTVYAR